MPDAEPRFERWGGPPDLPAAFTAFVTKVLGGRSLDDSFATESTEGEFPDFGLYRDLVLVEMKHLESEQRERVQSVLDDKIAKDEMPIFYGQRKISVNNADFSNGDEVLRAIFGKLNRSLEGHLSKANRQLRSYRARHPRKNAFNICVILNSKIADYTPEVVARAIHSKMQSQEGEQRFEAIDAVLYISEKHFAPLRDGRVGYPAVIFEGMGLIENGWKGELLDKIVQSWAVHRTGTPTQVSEDVNAFTSVEDVPEKLSRSDAWLLEYARQPYYQHLVLDELRVEFNRAMAINALTFIIGSWPKPPRWVTEEGLRRFQHLIAETNRRGIDIREMDVKKLTAKERKIVFEGLPLELVEKLSSPDRAPSTRS